MTQRATAQFRSRHWLNLDLTGPALWALWVYVLLLPLERVFWIPGLGTGTRLAGMVAAGVGIMAVAFSREFRFPRAVHVLIAAFAGWGALSFFWSIAPNQTATRAATIVQLLVSVWLVWQFAATRQAQRRLLQAYTLGAAVLAVATVLNSLLQRGVVDGERYQAFGNNPNQLGYLVVLSIPMSFYLAAAESHSGRVWLYRLHFGFATWAVLLTASRGALLGGLTTLFYLALAFNRLPRKRRRNEILVRLAMAACLPMLIPEATAARFPQAGSFATRVALLQHGFQIWREHPVIGVGADAFPHAVEPLLGRETTAHNVFFSVAAEQGLIGLGLFLALLASVLLRTQNLVASDRRLLVFLLSAWLIAAMLTVCFEHKKVTWFIFALSTTLGADRSPGAEPTRRRLIHSRAAGFQDHA